ncbi:MAG TPA: hypothetical protein VKR80_07445 [Candidatus Limnocylindria bacterium]|nr:hypothetical protein [Candidatus Limnocylindria bacterium]
MSEAAARDGLQKLGAAVPPHPTGADLDRAGSEYFRGAENGMAIMGPQPPMPLEERRRRLMNEAVQFRLGKGMPRAQAEQEVNRMYNVPPPTQPGAAPTGPIAGIIHGGSPLAAAAPFAPPGAAAPFAPEAAAPFAQQGAAAPLAAAAPIRAAMPTAAESADQELARRLAMARGGGMG